LKIAIQCFENFGGEMPQIRPLVARLVNGTRGVQLGSVVPITFGPIWLWFNTAR